MSIVKFNEYNNLLTSEEMFSLNTSSNYNQF